jgi:hypothetical protein
MHFTRWIIKENKNIQLICVILLCQLIWNLVYEIMNMHSNCVWNTGFKWATAEYFNGMKIGGHIWPLNLTKST